MTLESDEVLTPWKELKSIHRVVRKRLDERSGKTSEEMVYYISSSTESSLLRQSIRAHWEIENNLHHYLCVCVCFGHDASHKIAKNIAQIMDIIQKINLFIIMKNSTCAEKTCENKAYRNSYTEILIRQPYE